MNSRTLFTLVLVALLVTPGLASAAISGSPEISVSVADATVTPGEETTLDVVLLNSGDLESGSARNPQLNSEVTTARGTTVSVSDGEAPFEVTTGEQAIGTLPEGRTQQPISFDISVPDDAEPGTYEVPVTVEYDYYSYISETEGLRDRESVRRTFDVEVTVEESAQFSVVDIDTTTRVGGTGTVELTVENTGTAAANDATISLGSPSGDLTFGQSTSATRYVEALATGEQRTFEYRLTASQAVETESYPFTLTADYELDNGESRSTLPTSVAIQPQPEQDFTVVSTNNDVPIGGSGTYNVTLRNDGPDVANDGSVTLTSENPDITFGQSNAASRTVGNWGTGETKTVTFTANASPSAQRQSYSLSTAIAFEDDGGNAGQVQGITVGLTPNPRLITVVDTQSAVPIGDTGEFSVTMRNDGDRALQDASVTLTSQNADIAFGQSNSASQFVGGWAAGEERTVTFDATATSGAEQRDYTLSARVDYEHESGTAGQQGGLSLGLQPGAEQTFTVENVESSLQVGDDGQLQAELTNTGPRAVQDVVVVWTTEQRNINAIETEYSVGRLGAGESASFNFDVDISESARSGPRQFTLQTRYDNDDGEQRTSDPLNVRTEVAPESDEFDVAIESATVTAGQGTTIELEITNAKSETLTDISAKIFADSPISANDDEAFVSELEPGESTTTNFSISASGGALEKSYPISMDFQYEEADGDTITSGTYNIPVDVQQPSEGSGLPLLIIGGGLLLVVVAVGGYLRFR